MEKFKTLTVAEITVPERLRAINDDYALVIQASIVEHGQLAPIVVRITPNADRPYTLVAGAHRYRAIELLGDETPEIEAMVVKADKDEAIFLEISENWARNDLNVMDKAVFVETYRDVWEKVHGTINPKGGRPKKNSAKLAEFSESPVGILETEAKNGFFNSCADRLGISTRSVERLGQISKLPKNVRKAIANTPVADNQTQLLKLAKMPPEKLKKFPAALKETDDFKKSLEALEPPAPKPDPVMQQLSSLMGAWERAKPEARAKFLKNVGLTKASTKTSPQKQDQVDLVSDTGGQVDDAA